MLYNPNSVLTPVLTGSLQAALTPLAESMKELQAILSSSELYDLSKNSDIILNVELQNTEERTYLITLTHAQIAAHIKKLPCKNLSPQPFKVHFEKLTP